MLLLQLPLSKKLIAIMRLPTMLLLQLAGSS